MQGRRVPQKVFSPSKVLFGLKLNAVQEHSSSLQFGLGFQLGFKGRDKVERWNISGARKGFQLNMRAAQSFQVGFLLCEPFFCGVCVVPGHCLEKGLGSEKWVSAELQCELVGEGPVKGRLGLPKHFFSGLFFMRIIHGNLGNSRRVRKILEIYIFLQFLMLDSLKISMNNVYFK